MEYSKDRIIEINGQKYYLDQWDNETEADYLFPCSKCELQDTCDQMADDLNRIEFGLCHNIENKEYAYKIAGSYFKKI